MNIFRKIDIIDVLIFTIIILAFLLMILNADSCEITKPTIKAPRQFKGWKEFYATRNEAETTNITCLEASAKLFTRLLAAYPDEPIRLVVVRTRNLLKQKHALIYFDERFLDPTFDTVGRKLNPEWTVLMTSDSYARITTDPHFFLPHNDLNATKHVILKEEK